MTAKTLSSAFAALAFMLICVGLSGCVPRDLMGVRATSDGLEFMACDSLSTQAIEVWVSPAEAAKTDYKVVWRSTGDTSIRAGNVVIFGVDLPNMTTEVGPLPLDLEDSRIAISFEHLGAGGLLEEEVQASFSGKEISSEDWLDESGGHSSTPCQ